MEHDIEFADVRNLGFSTVAPASSRARRARVAVAAAVTLSRSLPHYSLTLTTTNHSQNTTLHSDTHDPFFESEPKGFTHQATQDQTLQENPGSASFMSGPIENLKSFGTFLTRPTPRHLNSAPPYAPSLAGLRYCFAQAHTGGQALHVRREVMRCQERGNSALQMRLCTSSASKNNKLTYHSRPVRRSG